MTIDIALTRANRELPEQKNTCSALDSRRLEAEILLAYALKRDRIWIMANPGYRLPSTVYRLFLQLISRRRKHEPIAYILGEKEFYGRSFKVTRDVLIPRPETELLVDLIKASDGKPFIWDVGTGSGALAVTLAKEIPGSPILATDISPAALKVARKNARLLAGKKIRFLKASLLDSRVKKILTQAAKKFPTLVVAANLPYLPISDKTKLEPDVTKYEPNVALFSGADGLELITRFLNHLAIERRHLGFKRVTIYLEFDPPQAKKILKLAKTLFPRAEIRIHKDLAKRNRVLEISTS
ncbi:MAG: peptide chain release factor N(5)-glutamine methyltransferase [Patescibacteria group bacterium]